MTLDATPGGSASDAYITLAEADAFDNPQQAKDEWSDPSAVTLVTPGALQAGKIEPKPQVQYPNGIDRLMSLAISSLHDVTGMNPEILGHYAAPFFTDLLSTVPDDDHRKQYLIGFETQVMERSAPALATGKPVTTVTMT